ncbi:MAG TPA: cytochrome b/b6 domain-containing protein [Longimicrobiaceae bacterium]|nr:cytochrome b/b6 domain-containing protein [Longimicrobiaceae bacterium]
MTASPDHPPPPDEPAPDTPPLEASPDPTRPDLVEPAAPFTHPTAPHPTASYSLPSASALADPPLGMQAVSAVPIYHPPAEGAGGDGGARPRKRHHWVVRLTHWVNAVALAVMVGSGLRIFNAYPAFARKGESFCCYPWAGKPIPRALTFGGWLGGARNWHFAMMWVLAVNGLIYLAFIYLHGEWRDLAPRRNDPRDAWQMVRFYLFARRDHPRQGKHNALQKGAYFAMPLVGVLAVLTGLAIWKPVQLAPLTALFGGYVWARWWHFVVMSLLVILALGHVFMVFAVDPYSLRSMLTGRYDPSLSPEERNGRPFYHLLPRSRGAAAKEAGR